MGYLQNVDNELYIHNWKSYFDSFKTFEVIDAESLIVIFLGHMVLALCSQQGYFQICYTNIIKCTDDK